MWLAGRADPAAGAPAPGHDERPALGRPHGLRARRRHRARPAGARAQRALADPRRARLDGAHARRGRGAGGSHRRARLAGLELPVPRRRLRGALPLARRQRSCTSWPPPSCSRCRSPTTPAAFSEDLAARAGLRGAGRARRRGASSWRCASGSGACPPRRRSWSAPSATSPGTSRRCGAWRPRSPRACRRRRSSRSSPRRPGGCSRRRRPASPGSRSAGDRVIVLGAWAEPGYDLTVSVGDVYPVSPDDPVSRMRRDDAALNVRGPRRSTTRAGPGGWAGAAWCRARALRQPPVGRDRPRRSQPARVRAEAPRSACADYADLVATAIANAEDRARLDMQAGTDAMTGLANHRAFRERLVQEVARAQRHGRPLTVGLVDVDGFQRLNDQLGVEPGRPRARRDRPGCCATACATRTSSPAWPATASASSSWRATAQQALRGADRARCAVAAHRLAPPARDDRLGRAVRPRWPPARRGPASAARASPCSRPRQHGGDLCRRYDPAVVARADGRQRTEELDRWQALLGLRALARAIDAKDPTTQEHSERVASLAARLAEVARLDARRVALLREAALLHDVGKIGVPDAILLKRGAARRGRVRGHARARGARARGSSADVLDEVQIRWIAGHHERPDGARLPASALRGDERARGRRAARAGRRLGRHDAAAAGTPGARRSTRRSPSAARWRDRSSATTRSRRSRCCSSAASSPSRRPGCTPPGS